MSYPRPANAGGAETAPAAATRNTRTDNGRKSRYTDRSWRVSAARPTVGQVDAARCKPSRKLRPPPLPASTAGQRRRSRAPGESGNRILHPSFTPRKPRKTVTITELQGRSPASVSAGRCPPMPTHEKPYKSRNGQKRPWVQIPLPRPDRCPDLRKRSQSIDVYRLLTRPPLEYPSL